MFRNSTAIVAAIVAALGLPVGAETAIYAGIAYEQDRDTERVVPVVAFEFGEWSVDLEETRLAVRDTASFGLDLAIGYDSTGHVDVGGSIAAYGLAGADLSLDVMQSLDAQGLSANLDLGWTLAFGPFEITPALGLFYGSDARIQADFDQAGLDAQTIPYVALSAFLPMSQSTAMLVDVTQWRFGDALERSGAVSGPRGTDVFVALVHAF